MAWVLFLLANLVALLFVREEEGIPLHFIWGSLTLLYAVRVWRAGTTVAVFVAVCAITGLALFAQAQAGPTYRREIPEVAVLIAMFVAIAWNARHRQAALTELRSLRDRERGFIQDFGHDLRTSVTVARGQAELIRRSERSNPGPTPGVGEHADILVEELDHLTTIASRLMLLANARLPDFLRREPVSLATLVDGIDKRWAALAPRTWRTSAGPGSVLADPERLGAALDAMVENAIQHTSSGGTIEILARRSGDRVEIEVSDDGDGIDPSWLPLVMDRFARSEDSHGSGLGLAIVKAVVEAHGGDVEVSSAPGEGSTFRLRLPAETPEREAAPPGR